MTRTLPRLTLVATLAVSALLGSARPARALERMCDPSVEDCRALLINLIRNERSGIDVAFWFMEDARYTTELIRRWQAGVPVRVLVDSRANASNPHNASRLAELRNAGIPMRERFASGILHWKMMLFTGQNTVEFSGANYSAFAWLPVSTYTNYIDESIFFTEQPTLVDSFKTRFDDAWTDASVYRDYANIFAAPARRYDGFPQDAQLNFPPDQSYINRCLSLYNHETHQIDAIMYRITDRRHTDALIAARARGVVVRLISEPQQYRDRSRLWHAWNIDRLYMAGVEIKQRAHAGLNHQKSFISYGTGTTVFGSSNWTSPSSNSQEEHNIFSRDPAMLRWFSRQFARKWYNLAGITENVPFRPLPPDTPTRPGPVNGSTDVARTITLQWYGGPWAHTYDIYLGTTPDPPLIATGLQNGPSLNTSHLQSVVVNWTFPPNTTFYWKVVGRTMANMTKASPVWRFTTGQ